MRIGIDIDDTLTDTTVVLLNFLEKHPDENVKKNIYEIIRGTYVSEETVNYYRNNIREVAKTIKVKENAKEVIDKLHEEGNEIIIITARNDNYYGNAEEYCKEYLKNHNIYYDKLLTNLTYKEETCKNEKIDIMIDDAVDTCDNLNKIGIKALLFNSELNKEMDTISQRVFDWNEVYNIIEKQN